MLTNLGRRVGRSAVLSNPSLVLGYGCRIDLVVAARDEVVGLHEFFVGWFTGSVEGTDQVFERFGGALHPEFSMISPSGVTLDRDAVLESVRAAHGTADASFRIEIRDLVELLVGVGAVVVGYEEWQFVGGAVDSRRVSFGGAGAITRDRRRRPVAASARDVPVHLIWPEPVSRAAGRAQRAGR